MRLDTGCSLLLQAKFSSPKDSCSAEELRSHAEVHALHCTIIHILHHLASSNIPSTAHSSDSCVDVCCELCFQYDLYWSLFVQILMHCSYNVTPPNLHYARCLYAVLDTRFAGIYDVGLGFIFLLPPVIVTLTNRRVYVILFLARPFGVFFFSCFSTFGVAALTLPARASEPCTLPMIAVLFG